MSRKSRRIPQRNKFFILTNGETEKNYFEIVRLKMKSLYEIEVKYVNGDPLQLVEQSEQYVEEANQVWCVFDIDNSYEEGRLKPALQLAQEIGVNIAFSNKAFEVWLISHYKKCNFFMDTTRHILEMNKIIKKKLQMANKEYSKSDREVLEKYFVPQYREAIVNCKVVHQQFLKDSGSTYIGGVEQKIWEWNSCSNVYELMEALQLLKD